MRIFNTKKLILSAIFAALIAIGAFIKIPVPVVPFTLQFLFVILSGLMLGANYGFISVLCYLMIGLVGMPVFADGGGLFYIFKPTFGYLIGFLIAAYIIGLLSSKLLRPSFAKLLFINIIGLIIVYFCGMVYYWLICRFYMNDAIAIRKLFLYCFVLAVPGDILLCIFSALLGNRLIPILNLK